MKRFCTSTAFMLGLGFVLQCNLLFAQNFWSQTGLVNVTVGALTTNSSGHIYTGTIGSGTFEKGLRISTDKGSTWKVLGFTSSYIYSIAVNSSGNVFVATMDSLFRSTDGGTSWTNLNLGASGQYPRTIQVMSGGTLLVGAGGGVYRSANNGDSWTASGLVGNDVMALLAGTDNFVIAGTDSGIFRSTDLGLTWTKSNTGFTMTGIYYFSSFLIKTNQEIYAGAYGGKNYSIDGGVYRTTNGGANWSKVAGVTCNRVFSFAQSSGGHLFAGTMDSAVYRSTDNGSTWNTIKTGLWGSYNARRMVMSPDGYLYAAMGNYGLFRSIQPMEVSDEQLDAPLEYHVYQNYPNPFNPSTTILYALGRQSHVMIDIVNCLGQVVETIDEGEQPAGLRSLYYRTVLPSGVYFCRLRIGNSAEIRHDGIKMVVLE